MRKKLMPIALCLLTLCFADIQSVDGAQDSSFSVSKVLGLGFGVVGAISFARYLYNINKPVSNDVLMTVFASNQLTRARALLKKRKVGNRRLMVNRTLLHHACWYSTPEMVSLLLQDGANIKATCDQGYGPLEYAARNSDVSIIHLLYRKGVKPKAEDHQFSIPLCEEVQEIISKEYSVFIERKELLEEVGGLC